MQGDPTKTHKTQGTDVGFWKKDLSNMSRLMAVVAVKSSPRGRLAAQGRQLPAHQSNHPWSWLSDCSVIQYPCFWAPREDPFSKGEAENMN